ncbi:MAG: hypothetical protein K1X36_04145 [Pyrinomonadaceae bacterium]|nr:hypothetical protein [Pyrinomonadaceae bacterium]
MAILGLLGLLLLVVGWVWLMVVAFKSGGALWAVLIFFFSWIAGLIFCFVKKDGWMQLGLMILGMILMIAGGSFSVSTSFGN